MDFGFSPSVIGGGQPTTAPVVQNSTPTAGQTIVITDTLADITLMLSPAGTLATLTVTLPTDGGSRIGQVVSIFTTQIITALTINGAASILNAVTTAALNGCSTYKKVAANTWARLL